MVVAVQKGLESLKEILRDKGYDMVTFGEYGYPIDAVIYRGHMSEASHIMSNNIPNYSHHSFDGSEVTRNYGVLMINSENKTIAEIEDILRKKVYSPLF